MIAAAYIAKPALKKLAMHGFVLIPTDLSWKRASQLCALGLAELYPFHQRWQGRLSLTSQGKIEIAEAIARQAP